MKYDAFISYRHTEKDMYVAKKIHKGLETFKVPGSVGKMGGKKKITRVFRDQEELPIGSDLDDNISEALRESEFLIVICSPNTPESYWVQKEITSFIEMHDRDHVLAVLVEGEPGDSFPAPLLTDENGNPVEPLAADVRGKDNKETNKKLKTELIRLAAPLLHCTYDDLRQRHRERRMKKIIAWVAALGVVLSGLGIGFGLYNAHVADVINEQYEQKQISQSKYLAETSLNLLKDGDRRSAVLVAMSALPSEDNPRPLVPEAEYALSKALYTYEDGTNISTDVQLKHDISVKTAHLSTDGAYTVTTDRSSNVFVWDNTTGECIFSRKSQLNTLGYYTQVEYAGIVNDKLFIAYSDEIVILSLDGQEIQTLKENVSSCILCPTTYDLLCLSSNEAFIVDTSSNEITDRIKGPEDNFYLSSSSVSDNGRFITLIGSSLFNDVILITQYDLETGKRNTFTYAHKSISHTATGVDGSSYILGNNLDYTETLSFESPFTVWGTSIPFMAQEVSWEIQHDISYGQFTTSNSVIKVKYIDDNSGETKPVVIMLVADTVYSYNALNGEKYCSAGFSYTVSDVLLSSSRYMYIGVSNGTISVADIFSGLIYEDSEIKTGIPILAFEIKSGIIMIKDPYNPYVTLLSGHRGPDYKEEMTLESSPTKVLFSRDNNSFAVVNNDYYGNFNVTFYDALTLKELNRWTYTYEGSSISSYSYLSKNCFCLYTMDAAFVVYDYETGQETVYSVTTDRTIEECSSFSGNKRFFAVNESGTIYLLDIDNGNMSNLGDSFDDARLLSVSNDGKRVFYFDTQTPLSVIDVSTGKISVLNDQCFSLPPSIMINTMVLSKDDKYIALCCVDEFIRIVETETGNILYEIPFSTKSNLFIAFSEDGKHLYFEGDDSFFKVFSLDEKAIIHIDNEAYNKIISLEEYEDILVLTTLYEVRLLTRDTFSTFAVIDNGIFYERESGKIYTLSGKHIASFVYADSTTLVERAMKEYENEMLSDLEKIKYHVE